jgi:hypothetical protein
MNIVEIRSLGNARVSRVGDGVFAIANFSISGIFSRVLNLSESPFRRDAETNTRDACATPINSRSHARITPW